jgi:hypothetical protein
MVWAQARIEARVHLEGESGVLERHVRGAHGRRRLRSGRRRACRTSGPTGWAWAASCRAPCASSPSCRTRG